MLYSGSLVVHDHAKTMRSNGQGVRIATEDGSAMTEPQIKECSSIGAEESLLDWRHWPQCGHGAAELSVLTVVLV